MSCIVSIFPSDSSTYSDYNCTWNEAIVCFFTTWVDDPGAFVTVADIPPSPCSAKADGATAISEKIASNENDKYIDFFI